jgi:hypothetical protein
VWKRIPVYVEDVIPLNGTISSKKSDSGSAFSDSRYKHICLTVLPQTTDRCPLFLSPLIKTHQNIIIPTVKGVVAAKNIHHILDTTNRV